MKNLLFLMTGMMLIPACSNIAPENRKDLVFVVNSGMPQNKNCNIYIDRDVISKRMGAVNYRNLILVDLNNNKLIKLLIVDSDTNGIPEGISFITSLNQSEPVRTFQISEGEKRNTVITRRPDTTFTNVEFLTAAHTRAAYENVAVNWPETVVNTVLKTYSEPVSLEIFSRGQWSYTNGFFLNALSELYLKTKNADYLYYIKHWADLFITPAGSIDKSKYAREDFELDNILPGRLLIFLHQQTKDVRYKKAAGELLDQLNHQPRTSEGGFWHKQVYPFMMWLDGIYMADVFLAQYASAYDQPALFDEAAKQIELIYGHTLDTKTGLLYHGWDESKNPVWADPVKGNSPEFWGRAIGWYMMALADVLDYLPVNHSQRENILNIFRNLSESLVRYQDSSGMWYQVVDKGSRPDNWLESSCTAMFGYAFAKGVRKGYLDKSYLKNAQNAFNGLINNEVYFDEKGRFYLTGTVKVGTLNLTVSKGDYNYYVGVDRRINDFKGVAAFLYLAMEMEKI